jgi:hypothetical protein
MRSLACLCALVWVAPVAASDYLIVFSADSVPYRPTGAHTFAAVVQTGMSPAGTPIAVDVKSLSWLPDNGNVRAFAMRSETGRNVPLDETLRDRVASGSRICAWGPYRLRPEMADKFRGRVAAVESRFQYKAACFTSPLDVCDCARSIEELVGHRRFIGTFGYGAAVSSVIVRKYSPWLIDPQESHPDVARMIGLDEYPIIFRSYGDYATKQDQFKASIRRR